MESKLIKVVDFNGITAHLQLSYFLMTFYASSWKYIPRRGIVDSNCLINLKDLFYDLWIESESLCFRAFLYFHIMNKKFHEDKIYWELL